MLALLTAASDRFAIVNRIPLPRSNDSLNDRAQELIERLGYRDPPADSARGIALVFTVLLRFGLLSLIITLYTFLALESFPLTMDVSRPYSGAGLLLVTVIAGLSLFGFYASRGDEPLFGPPLLD